MRRRFYKTGRARAAPSVLVQSWACPGVGCHGAGTAKLAPVKAFSRAQSAPMATNYVLVDFENVQPDSLEPLTSGAFRVKVFVGAQQAKGRVSFEFSESMQKLGSHAEYVRIARSGPNAVDMHIAYYVGRLLEKEPHASVYIISRDTDFDPLVEYLNARGGNCRRVRTIADVLKLVPRP